MASKKNFAIVYMTFPSQKEAEKIGSFLVKNKLVACVNILAPHTSIYSWEGKINKTKEIAMIAKTLNSNVKKVIRAVQLQHSYDCPAIISWKIKDGSKDFLNWIEQSLL